MGSILNNREISLVVQGLEKQGAIVTRIAGGRYKVANKDGHMVALSLATFDRQQMMGGKAKLQKLGFAWPLDIIEERPKSAVATDLTDAEIAAAQKKAQDAQARIDAQQAALKPPKPQLPPKQSKLTTAVETVTPEIAEQWLGFMGKNRKLSGDVVDRLADMMKGGLWVFDGSPIRFNTHGELVDGQHRLWAIIEAGHTAEFLVLRGVDPEAMAIMDTGRRRSFSDILVLDDPGLTQHTSLAATIQIIIRWEQGLRGNGLLSGRAGVVIPNQRLLDFFHSHKERLVDVTRRARVIAARMPGVPASVTALLLWVFEDLSVEDAEDFFSKVQDGVGLEPGSPILTLRNWIVRNGMSRQKVATDTIIAIFFKAWNAYRSGDSASLLTYRRGGASPEVFPTPL